MENHFISLKVKKSVIDNEYKYESATDQGNGTASSRRPAIIPLNDGQVRICLYVSLALCDPNSDYHKLSNLPRYLILLTNTTYDTHNNQCNRGCPLGIITASGLSY